MNRSQRFVCSFIALVAVACIFPLRSPVADDWLPINPADLALKDNPADPGANAMILYRESAVNEKYVNTDGASISEYMRIKIFTKEGATNEGDVEIPYLKNGADIKNIRARTIRPDGSIVNFEGKAFEKTVQKRSGVKILAKTFTLPDVQPGCIIEYKYITQYKPNLLYDENWIVTSSLYTREGHFSILPYSSNYQNFPLYFRQFAVKNQAKPEKDNSGVYSLTLHDIPGIEDEAYMPPLQTIEGRIEFYHRSEDEPLNETADHYWARIGKNLNDELEHFISKKGALQKDLAQTVSPDDAPDVKLRKIYDRVQKIRDLSIEYSKSDKEIKQENLKKNNNVEDMLNHGYGNGREMNYLFVGLARAAGFSASEVFVADRGRTFFIPQMQNVGQLQADIVWVQAGGKEYYLDPAANYFPFGILPWFETNTNGLRLGLRPNDFITVPMSAPSDATFVRHADLTLDDEGQAQGTVSVDFTGQEAALRREDNHHADETGRKKYFEDEIHGWLPNGSSFELTKIDNWDKNDQPIHVEGTVKLGSLGSPAGHRMIVPGTIFQSRVANAFESATRHNNIYFRFPYQEIDSVKFHPPAGFKIGTLPAAKELKPSPVVGYEISASQQGSAVEVKRQLTVNGVLFDVKYYSPLRTFFSTVKTNDQTQIILQNSESAKNN